jgi:hypothetical protein
MFDSTQVYTYTCMQRGSSHVYSVRQNAYNSRQGLSEYQCLCCTNPIDAAGARCVDISMNTQPMYPQQVIETHEQRHWDYSNDGSLLHRGLCAFQSARWHATLQYSTRLQEPHRCSLASAVPTLPHTAHRYTDSSTRRSAAAVSFLISRSHFMPTSPYASSFARMALDEGAPFS